jgi:hypothetical protein
MITDQDDGTYKGCPLQIIGNKPFCVKSKNKFPPECSGTSRSFCLIFAGYQFWTTEKNLSFAVAGAFQAQNIPRSRIRRVLFLRQKRFTSN